MGKYILFLFCILLSASATAVHEQPGCTIRFTPGGGVMQREVTCNDMYQRDYTQYSQQYQRPYTKIMNIMGQRAFRDAAIYQPGPPRVRPRIISPGGYRIRFSSGMSAQIG